jgi:hypothetical protein
MAGVSDCGGETLIATAGCSCAASIVARMKHGDAGAIEEPLPVGYTDLRAIAIEPRGQVRPGFDVSAGAFYHWFAVRAHI